MIELKLWAKTVALILVGFAFHFAGWAFAAPVGWKLIVGCVGFGVSVAAMIPICIFGKEKGDA